MGADELADRVGLTDADENREIHILSASLVNEVGYAEGFRWLCTRL